LLELKIIIGSTRPGRAADRVVPWITRRAADHGSFAVEVLDLRDWSLPMFAETFETLGDPHDPTFSTPVVKAWNTVIGSGDAFVFITPEYNHGIPAVLKNAIDSVFATFGFRNKPAVTVAYSGGAVGGARAVEQLALVAVEAEMVPLRNSVLIANVASAFDGDGIPTDPRSDAAVSIALDDLAWWGEALRAARTAGQLPPAMARLMTAAGRN
jgi:NAD(P)H-dependent FMN reductase